MPSAADLLPEVDVAVARRALKWAWVDNGVANIAFRAPPPPSVTAALRPLLNFDAEDRVWFGRVTAEVEELIELLDPRSSPSVVAKVAPAATSEPSPPGTSMLDLLTPRELAAGVVSRMTWSHDTQPVVAEVVAAMTADLETEKHDPPSLVGTGDAAERSAAAELVRGVACRLFDESGLPVDLAEDVEDAGRSVHMAETVLRRVIAAAARRPKPIIETDEQRGHREVFAAKIADLRQRLATEPAVCR